MASSLQIELMCAPFVFADRPYMLPPSLRPAAQRWDSRAVPYIHHTVGSRGAAVTYRNRGAATGTVMPKHYAPKTYGAHEMVFTRKNVSNRGGSCAYGLIESLEAPEASVPQPRAQGMGRLARQYEKGKARGGRKLPPGSADPILKGTSMPESLGKFEQTDGERWAEEMLEAELWEEELLRWAGNALPAEAKLARQVLEAAERDHAAGDYLHIQNLLEQAQEGSLRADLEAEIRHGGGDPPAEIHGGDGNGDEEEEEAWELVESSPSERLLAPMPQPRTVFATEPVTKRVVAFPVAGMVVPTATPRGAPAGAPREGLTDWDAKAARERTRERFLKEKAARAAAAARLL